eukprot:3634276-Rhodomonas_salina.1
MGNRSHLSGEEVDERGDGRHLPEAAGHAARQRRVSDGASDDASEEGTDMGRKGRGKKGRSVET